MNQAGLDYSGNTWLGVHWHWNIRQWCQSVFECQWTHRHVFLHLSDMWSWNAQNIFIYVNKCVSFSPNAKWSLGLRHFDTWASHQIRNITGCACAGNAGNVSFATDFKRKPLVSDPGMHHNTWFTHVPWCMSGSETRGGGEHATTAFPTHAQPASLRIW